MDGKDFLKRLDDSGYNPLFSCGLELRIELFEAAKPLLLSEGDLRHCSKERLLMSIDHLAGKLKNMLGGQGLLNRSGYTEANLRDFSRTQLLDLLRSMEIAIALHVPLGVELIEKLFQFEPLLLRDARVLFLITEFEPDGHLDYSVSSSTEPALRDSRAAPLLLKLVSAIESAGKSDSIDHHSFMYLLGLTRTDEAVIKLGQVLEREEGDVMMHNCRIGWNADHPPTLKGVVINALGNSENELAVHALRKKLESDRNPEAREAIQFQLGRLSTALEAQKKRLRAPSSGVPRPGHRTKRALASV